MQNLATLIINLTLSSSASIIFLAVKLQDIFLLIESVKELPEASSRRSCAVQLSVEGMFGGKYVPPALRGEANNNQEQDTCPETKLYTLDEICASFGYPVGANANANGEKATSTTTKAAEGETAEVENSRRDRGTLNVAYDAQDKLAYIILYHGAHPFWEAESEVFCKTNLDLLPKPSSMIVKHDKPVYDPYFPVFTQRKRLGYTPNRARALAFDGYYGIKAIRYLEPQSEELVEYLQVKFGEKARGPQAWKESLSLKWAVITLVRDESRIDEAPPVQAVQRSVNEMLAEARG